MTDNGADDTLTPRQHKALSALLSEPTIRKAAEACGVPEKTLYRWLKDDTFADAYRAALRAVTRHAIARLQQASPAAVGVLCRLMATGNPPAVRLGAASKLLDMAFKAAEVEDLAARLEALEAKYAQH